MPWRINHTGEILVDVREMSPAQRAYVHSFLEFNDWYCGRGGGKTLGAVVKSLIALLNPSIAEGAIGIITQSSEKKIRQNLYPAFRDLVPSQLYKYNKGDHIVELFNGSELWFMSRDSWNSQRDSAGRGPNGAFVIHDEMAEDPDRKAYDTFLGLLRHRSAPIRFCDRITTPVLGWLKADADKYGLGNSRPNRGMQSADPWRHDVTLFDGHSRSVIYSSTRGNKHNRGLAELLESVYDPNLAAQEILGQWIARSGRLWDNWVDADWPDGNLIDWEFDRAKPWMLSADIGVARSSWLAWQLVPVIGHGTITRVWCVVAEWQFNDLGVSHAMESILGEVGSHPSRFFCGHDSGTRSTMNEAESADFFSERYFGFPAEALDGIALSSPHVRYNKMRTAIEHKGARKLVLSRQRLIHDPQSRGIEAVLQQDSWPSKGSSMMRKGAQDPQGLEHCRDALHHFLCVYDPPQFIREKYAA